jgi:hypothetical protein
LHFAEGAVAVLQARCCGQHSPLRALFGAVSATRPEIVSLRGFYHNYPHHSHSLPPTTIPLLTPLLAQHDISTHDRSLSFSSRIGQCPDLRVISWTTLILSTSICPQWQNTSLVSQAKRPPAHSSEGPLPPLMYGATTPASG